MKQPELGQKIADVRKDKNLTQEELVELCHVSVRTIQRIESGEVTPRLSTIKIILAALDINIETLRITPEDPFSTSNYFRRNLLFGKEQNGEINDYQNFLQIAGIAGVIYFALGIVETGMDYENFKEGLNEQEKIFYTVVKSTVLVSYFLFMRGFMTLGILFKNSLLRLSASVMIVVNTIMMLGDIYLAYFPIVERNLMIVYATQSVMLGSVGIIFGLALLRLQDGMGDFSRISGILEILIGCTFISVFLFFVGYVLMIPTLILEIVILFKGYEFIREQNLQKHAAQSSA